MSSTLILGHRGAPLELPENTIAGLRRAAELGADGVELDVHLSADGVPVVIHDPTLDRTTAGRGRVREQSWAQLRPWVPSLDDAARWAWEIGVWLNVELKAAGTEAPSLAVLERHGVVQQCIVSSFLPDVVREVRRLNPSVSGYLLTERWDTEARDALRYSGAGGVCLGVAAADERTLRTLANEGLPVIVWTVDDEPRLRRLLAAGIMGIITNDPGRAVALRREG